MERKTAAIIGATGLIGSHLLQLLIDNPDYSQIKVVVRRAVTINNPKVHVVLIDFSDRHAFKQALSGSDAVFCAVGTTQKKVKGNKEAYRKVDYDIPVTAARLCEEMGVGQFLLVSSIGANSGSRSFYTKLKGEVEDVISTMRIPSVSIFRPSLLLGEREEFRLGEKIGEVLMKGLVFFLPSKYRSIHAGTVAYAMFNASRLKKAGVTIYHFEEMIQLEGKV